MEYDIFGNTTRNVRTLGLGVFDGMHLGHQEIASRCDALLTFNPHPDIVLGKTQTLKRLTTIQELHYYMPTLFAVRFSSEVAALEPEAFLDTIQKRFSPKNLVFGYDYRFGRLQTGTIHTLIDWAAKHQIAVTEIPPFCLASAPVKSARIRELMMQDEFDQAIQLLGHPYLVQGVVVRGEGRGRQLGFPTANIEVSAEKLVPSSGVYKGYVELGTIQHNAMIYVGNKPTFGGDERCVEVYILDFDRDIYNRQLRVFFTSKLRDDIRFDSVKALILQIHRDIQACY